MSPKRRPRDPIIPPPPPEPDPPPDPDPGAYEVSPGQDIATLAASNDSLLLLAGTHDPFQIDTAGVTIQWAPGAVVHGGAWVNAANVTFISPVVTNAVRGIKVLKGGFVCTNPDVYGCGNGFLFNGSLAGGTVTGGQVHDNTRVIRNTQSPNGEDYGAMGFDFHDTNTAITISGVKVYNNRVKGPAPSTSWNHNTATLGTAPGPEVLSWDYGTNEGAAFELWQSRNVTIEDCRTWNNQIVIETGRSVSQGGPECNVTFRNNRNWNGKTDPARLTKGLLLRTATSSLIEHNVFDRLDHWAISVQGGGGFGGSVSGLVIRDNITVTPAQFLAVSSPSGSWSHDYNLVGGTKAWGSGGSEAHGIAADPQFTTDYALASTSPAQSAGHDGSDMGVI